MTSRSRERYVPRGSRASEAGARAGFGWSFTASAISASIVLVTSGRAGAPSGVENLIRLYSGGLWEAVKFIAPSARSRVTAYAIAGGRAGWAVSSGVMPGPARIADAMEEDVGSRNGGS